MNRRCELSSTYGTIHSDYQMMTGCYKRSLSTHGKFRLPKAWAPAQLQTWLLYPTQDFPDSTVKSLRLLQAEERVLRFIVSESPAHANSAPDVETVLRILQCFAGRNGLPGTLVTALQVSPAPSAICLRTEQIDWLVGREPKVILTGCANSAYLYSPSGWKKLQRERKRKPTVFEVLFADETPSIRADPCR